MRQRSIYIPLQDNVWKDCKSIYKWLSHHYVRRRSVVFIVDTQFDSVVYRDKAMKYVRSFYRNRLNEQDYFGYISLDESQQAAQDEILLERRNSNISMKKNLMREIARREMDYVFASGAHESSKTIRLERALDKAFEW